MKSFGIADIQTGKITGCKEGSLVWFHEKGHIEYNNSERGSRNSFLQQSALINGIFFLCLALFINPFKFLALFCLLIYLGLNFYEEHWCWRYARIHFQANQYKYKNTVRKVDNVR